MLRLPLRSGPPEVSKCTIDGEGLRSATAGLPAVLSVLVFCFLKKPVHPAEKDRKGEEDSMYAV